MNEKVERMIKQLDVQWVSFCEEQGNKTFKCERCEEQVLGKNYNEHCWKKHLIWMFNRRTGIHWQLHKLKVWFKILK